MLGRADYFNAAAQQGGFLHQVFKRPLVVDIFLGEAV